MDLMRKGLLLLIGAFCLSSCATIINGTHQTIGISSNPSNAAIWIDGMYCGDTPLLVGLTRSDSHFVRLELQGFQPFEVVFSRQVSGWVFGNIVFGGVIGLAVDAISGGIYRLTPDQIQAELRNGQEFGVDNNKNSYFFVVLQPKPDWQKVGSLAQL